MKHDYKQYVQIVFVCINKWIHTFYYCLSLKIYVNKYWDVHCVNHIKYINL